MQHEDRSHDHHDPKDQRDQDGRKRELDVDDLAHVLATPAALVATAVVAVAFQPVRERVQHLANRLVFGKRATPYEALSAFAAARGTPGVSRVEDLSWKSMLDGYTCTECGRCQAAGSPR